jgi:hypothetical protein
MAGAFLSSDWLVEFNRHAAMLPPVDPTSADEVTEAAEASLDPHDDASWTGALELGLVCSDLPVAGAMHCRAQIAPTGQMRLLPPTDVPLPIATLSEVELRRWAGRPVKELISSAYHDEITIRGDVNEQALFIAAHADPLARSRFIIPNWPRFTG